MKEQSIGPAELATDLETTHASVIRWRDRKSIPRRDMMAKIKTRTEGVVTEADFYQ